MSSPTNSPQPNVIYLPKISQPIPAPANTLGLYFDKTTGKLTGIDSDGNASSFDPGGAPGGADTNVQFNDNGTLGGDATFTFDKATDILVFDSATPGAAIELTVEGVGCFAFLGAGTTGNVGVDINSSIDDGVLIFAGEVPSGGINIQNAPATGTSGSVRIGHGPVIGTPDQSIVIDSNGTHVAVGGGTLKLGFLGAAPIVRPAITGAKAGNTALASLITQGVNLGLWTDSTT
jgi:hypothetical protein